MTMKTTDEILDAAAAEALGMNAATAVADVERDLRETVSRLAAAAPYMKPPEELRGRILQATAPATFRMEDYRKATGENMRIYKWGFYAAAMFLMVAAWFNIAAKNSNKQLQATLQNTVASANKQLQEESLKTQVIQSALATAVGPNVERIRWANEKGETQAYAFVDRSTGKAVVIAPPGFTPQAGSELTLTGADGKQVAFNTTFLLTPAPAGSGTGNAAMALNAALNEKELSPDSGATNKVYRASTAIPGIAP